MISSFKNYGSFVFLFFQLFLACRGVAAETLSNAPTRVTFANLVAGAKTAGATQVEDLLGLLTEPFSKNFALVFDSRSNQQFASPAWPRVITFDPNAKLFLAFGTKPGERGYQSLEVIEFDNVKKSFDFHEIRFNDRKLEIQSNASSCTVCHNGRPIWDTYDSWPGAFGQLDVNPLGNSPTGVGQELYNLRAFLGAQRFNSRYAWLDMDWDAESLLSSLEVSNTELLRTLSRFNVQRIANEIRSRPAFNRLQADIPSWFWLDNGPSLGHYVHKFNPKSSVTDLKKIGVLQQILKRLSVVGFPISNKELALAIARIHRAHETYYRGKDQRMGISSLDHPASASHRGLDFENDNLLHLALFDRLAARGAVPGPETWSMTFERGSYAINTPEYILTELGNLLTRPEPKSLCEAVFR